jgi:hypothetical protein
VWHYFPARTARVLVQILALLRQRVLVAGLQVHRLLGDIVAQVPGSEEVHEMNSVSLAGRVASLLPNTTAAAMDSPQACGHSCADVCAASIINGVIFSKYTYWLCCASGCWSQGCRCRL